MNKGSPQQPPQRVPVLTEVVVLPKGGKPAGPSAGQVTDLAFAATSAPPLSDWAPSGAKPLAAPAVPAVPAAAPAVAKPVAPPVAAVVPPSLAIASALERLDEGAIAQRVLADVERQLDLMFEHRLRETMAPVLARMTDTLVRELRNQLATTLREMVARSVAQELERLRRR